MMTNWGNRPPVAAVQSADGVVKVTSIREGDSGELSIRLSLEPEMCDAPIARGCAVRMTAATARIIAEALKAAAEKGGGA
jgi:hypothetical protein